MPFSKPSRFMQLIHELIVDLTGETTQPSLNPTRATYGQPR